MGLVSVGISVGYFHSIPLPFPFTTFLSPYVLFIPIFLGLVLVSWQQSSTRLPGISPAKRGQLSLSSFPHAQIHPDTTEARSSHAMGMFGFFLPALLATIPLPQPHARGFSPQPVSPTDRIS